MRVRVRVCMCVRVVCACVVYTDIGNDFVPYVTFILHEMACYLKLSRPQLFGGHFLSAITFSLSCSRLGDRLESDDINEVTVIQIFQRDI